MFWSSRIGCEGQMVWAERACVCVRSSQALGQVKKIRQRTLRDAGRVDGEKKQCLCAKCLGPEPVGQDWPGPVLSSPDKHPMICVAALGNLGAC